MDDAAAWVTTAYESGDSIQCEYHVLFSSSHQVPVLYFRASTLGMVLPHAEYGAGEGFKDNLTCHRISTVV